MVLLPCDQMGRFPLKEFTVLTAEQGGAIGESQVRGSWDTVSNTSPGTILSFGSLSPCGTPEPLTWYSGNLTLQQLHASLAL